MMLLPLAEILVRRVLTTGIPGAGSIVQHLTLWVGFLGAALAAREDRLLAIATALMLPKPLRAPAAVFAAAATVAVVTMLFWGALQLIETQRELGATIALRLPVWIVQIVLPAAFAAIGVRQITHASHTRVGRVLAATGMGIGALLLLFPSPLQGRAGWLALVVVVSAGLAGAPIFAVLGGAAVLL
ncbi:MAG TPA: TRAP transporter small permease subunit, partial [Longimicrobiales bacterium]|nr:TRAP transporter small permease subunit [Longimicrobiales bacterium]